LTEAQSRANSQKEFDLNPTFCKCRHGRDAHWCHGCNHHPFIKCEDQDSLSCDMCECKDFELETSYSGAITSANIVVNKYDQIKTTIPKVMNKCQLCEKVIDVPEPLAVFCDEGCMWRWYDLNFIQDD
jgi:hypothetical protein